MSLAYEAAVSGDALESNVRLYLLLTSATAYRTRYDRTADPDTLAMAQAIVARVVEEVGEDHPLSGAAAHLLGTILLRRYHRSGADVDLHAALVCLRTAAELEDTPVHLADLADALRLRASLESDDSLRIEAFSVSERAGGLTAAQAADAHAVLLAHGCALAAAHESRPDDTEMIATAVVFLRLALGRLPPEHPARGEYVGALADAWLLKHSVTETTTDLAGALDATTAAVRATPEGHPQRPRHLERRDRGMIRAFTVSEELDQLRRAVLCFGEAADLLPQHHPFCHVIVYANGEPKRKAALDQLRRVGLNAAPVFYFSDKFICEVVSFDDKFVRRRLDELPADVFWAFPVGLTLQNLLNLVGEDLARKSAVTLLGSQLLIDSAVEAPSSSSRVRDPWRGVLISADEDQPRAGLLRGQLEQDGFTCWFSAADVAVGDVDRVRTAQVIREARIAVVCFSHAALQGEGEFHRQVKVAVECADERPEGVPFIFPVLLDPCDVPEHLRGIRAARLFEADGYRRLLKALRRAAEQWL